MIYLIVRFFRVLGMGSTFTNRTPQAATAAATATAGPTTPPVGAVNVPVVRPKFWSKIHRRDHELEFVERFWVTFLLVTIGGGVGILINILIAALTLWWLPFDAQLNFCLAGWLSIPITFLIVSSFPSFRPWIWHFLFRLFSTLAVNFIVGFIISMILVAPIRASL